MLSMQLLQAVHGKKQSPLTTKTTFICKFSRESDKSINEKRSMVNCTCHYNVFCPRFDKAGMVCHYLELLDPSDTSNIPSCTTKAVDSNALQQSSINVIGS